MGILRNIISRFTGPTAGHKRFFKEMLGHASEISDESAIKFSAVYAAVNRISSDIAKLPLKLMESRGGKREVARGHALHRILSAAPNSEQTSFAFRKAMMWDVLLNGNAYAEIQRTYGGDAVALNPIPSASMIPTRRDSGELAYQYTNKDGVTVFNAGDILHIRGGGTAIEGLSPIALFRTGIGLALAAEKAGETFFRRGMRPGGTLSHPALLSDQALQHLRGQAEDQAGGYENHGRLLILEEGLKYTPMAIPPTDAQYIETRVHQVREIARIFQIPPHKLADMADATFSNVEEQNSEYVDDCLAPWLVQWEQELSFKLLQGDDGLYPHFQVDALLRGNSQSRADFYSKMFHIGGFSINEIREKEDMDGIGPAGDIHMVPVNLQGTDAKDKAARMVQETIERLGREESRSGKPADAERRAALLKTPVECYAAITGADAASLLERLAGETTTGGVLRALEERP